MIIDGIDVTFDIAEAEAREYVKSARKGCTAMRITALDDDYVDIEYEYTETVPFERIRRITGYLVGDLGRFNDAKLSEVHDRVKHGVGL